MAAFLTPALLGLVLLLVGGAMALASAIGFGARPNRRSAALFVLFTALGAWGWQLLAG